VFDVDGVVVQANGFRRVLEANYGISPDRTRSFFAGPFLSCIRGESDLRVQVLPFLESWGWPGGIDDFIEVWFEADGVVDASVLSFIDELRDRGFRCHVASNQERYRAADLTERLNLRSRFDRLFFSCDLGVLKPELEYFSAIAASLGAEGRDLILIDDLLHNVEGARAAGWSAVLYSGVGSLIEVNKLLSDQRPDALKPLRR
jgi:putative hydrolase of the HAD superfamily